MKYEIENAQIKISVDSVGAELKSIIDKKHMTQFLYDGMDRYWSSSSPVLFPFVGRLKLGRYLLNGKSYEMPIHGFAHRLDFEAEMLSDTVLSFTLKSSRETFQLYPFDFKLAIIYEIDGNRIKISYNVENTGIEDMYFTLGAHPGFLCPLTKKEKFSDYYLELDKKETASLMHVTSEGLFSHDRVSFLTDENHIDLDYDLFDNDALVFYDLKSNNIKLKSKNHDKYVQVDFAEFKYLGIWTLRDAPFVCIEPWLGHGDFEDFSGDLRDKPDMIKLELGKIFSVSLSVSIF